MENTYTLQRYFRGVFIYLGNDKIHIESFYTSTANYIRSDEPVIKDTFIEYDKQKKNISNWGDYSFKSDNDDGVKIDNFTERLYQLFKKDKDCWSQDDIFLLQAISDFMRLLVEQLIKESKEVKATSDLHYVLVVPSEWEEDIREAIIRPIFFQANLTSKNDHKDRILFCTDIESFYYYTSTFSRKLGKDTVLCRLTPTKKNQVLIKLDLISSVNYLFNFSDSLVFPKVVDSNSFEFSIGLIKDSIRALLKNRLSLSIRKKSLKSMIETIFRNISSTKNNNKNDGIFLMVPLITNTRKWGLDTCQATYIKTICPYDICAELSKRVPNNVKNLISSNVIKEYPIITIIDEYSTEVALDRNLVNWSKSMLEYNRINSNLRTSNESRKFTSDFLQTGVIAYVYGVIQSSNMYSKPIILPTDEVASYSSIFLRSKPDVIMNIDISSKSTLLSFSLLDDNGFIQKFWGHDFFVKDTCLRPLGSFFKISDVPILYVNYRFIVLAERYFIGDSNILSGGEYVTNNYILTEIDAILNSEGQKNDLLVSVQQQVFIKAFIMTYMIYVKSIVSSKIKTISSLNFDIKTGYAITIKNKTLNYLFGSKEELNEVIYKSGLLKKDDKFSKIRIMTREEELVPIIRRSLTLPFTLRSFFVLAQIHKNYVQLTLSLIVLEFSQQDDQESIIIQNETIQIPNIYDSLFLRMWNKILGGGSLVQLCDVHKNHEFLDIFTIQNHKYFKSNFKQYISKNVLKNDSILKENDEISINICQSCNCKVCLTINDLLSISFRPVLQEIISIVSTSLINEQIFGKYFNIQYIFYLIRFNNNPHFRPIFTKILKDGMNEFMYENEIEIRHYVIPKPSHQDLHPVCKQRPLSYKGFQVGTLHHVHCGNFGFNFITVPKYADTSFKNRRSDTRIISIKGEAPFPTVLKGLKVMKVKINRVLCLEQQKDIIDTSIGIEYFKFYNTGSLDFGKAIPSKNMSEPIIGPFLSSKEFKQGQDLAISITVIYNGHSSTFSLMSKRAGDFVKEPLLLTVADQMTLARF